MTISQDELRKLALTGVQLEIERLNAVLGELQNGRRKQGRPKASLNASGTPTVPGRRKGMSPAARKAQSLRMKAMWAAKRKAQK